MRYTYSALTCFWILLLTACLDSDPEPRPIPPFNKKTMTGKVILPSETNLSFNDMEVLSSISDAQIQEGIFSIDTMGEFSTLFVTNNSGDIFLMKYNYPSQTDHNISPESTALAIVMNAPVMESLTQAAKLQVIKNLQEAPGYYRLVNEVTQSIVTGKPISDTTNTNLINATAELFDNVSSMRADYFRPKPIKIQRANNVVLIQNNDVAHNYVAGIYKNETRLKKIIIKGTQKFANSLKEALLGIFYNGYSSQDEHLFTMESDGTYLFKIRSGLPFMDDESKEFEEAQKYNIEIFIAKQVLKHIPIKNSGECQEAILKGIATRGYDPRPFKSAKTQIEIGSALFDLTSSVFNDIDKILGNCVAPPKLSATKKFFSAAGKFLKFLNPVSKVAQSMNIAVHTFDLVNSKPSIDTCFQVLDRKVELCSLGFYRRAVIGNWTFRFDYLTYDDGVHQIDKVVFYEDGTGKRVSTLYPCYPRYGCTEDTFYDHTDKWGTDPYYDLVWSVTYDSFKKRYIFNSYDKRWTQNIAVELNSRMEGLSSNSFRSSTYNIIAIKEK